MDFEGSKLVTVSCANHCQYVALALQNLFDSRRGTDFHLRWGEDAVRAHRIILELFLDPGIIGSNVDEQPHAPAVKQEVLEHDCESPMNILDSLLEFMYKGEVSVPEHKLEYLLRVARELDFQMLVDAIVHSYSFKDYTDGSDLEVKVEDEGEDRTIGVDITHRISENCTENDDGPQCSQTGQIKSRTVTPIYNFSHKVSAPQVVHRLEQGERQGLESNTDPGCSSSSAYNIKVEPELISSDDECSVPDDWIGSDRPPSLLQSRSHQEHDVRTFSNHDAISLDVEADRSPTSHLNADEQAKLFRCAHCEFETLKYSTHHQHLLAVHGLTCKGKPAKKHHCPECDFSSFLSYKIKKHMLIRHSKEKPYACPHCSYVGKVKNTLDRHVAVVHGMGHSRFTCDFCGKRSASRSILERHMRTHTKKRTVRVIPKWCSSVG